MPEEQDWYLALAGCADVGGTGIAGRQVLAWGAAGRLTLEHRAGLVAINYRSSGLSVEAPGVAAFRGLVVHAADPVRVLVPSSTPFHDVQPDDAFTPEGALEVSSKMDGVLVALFHEEGRWRAATRCRLDGAAVELAERAVSPSLGRLDHDVVLYVELCDPSLPLVIPHRELRCYLVDAKVRTGAAQRTGVASVSTTDLADLARGPLELPSRVPWPGSLSRLWNLLRSAPDAVEGYVLRDARPYRMRLVKPQYAAMFDLAFDPTDAMVRRLHLDGWEVSAIAAGVRHIVGAGLDRSLRTLEAAKRACAHLPEPEASELAADIFSLETEQRGMARR